MARRYTFCNNEKAIDPKWEKNLVSYFKVDYENDLLIYAFDSNTDNNVLSAYATSKFGYSEISPNEIISKLVRIFGYAPYFPELIRYYNRPYKEHKG